MTEYNGWTYDWEGRELLIHGRKVKIETQLTEWLDDVLAQRHVLTLARNLDRGIPIMLKITYDLNPKHFPLIDNVEETLRVAERHACFEVTLIKLIHSIGHGPESLSFGKSKQNEWMPYPGGRIYYVVMTRVPGENVERIPYQLSSQQRQSIRSQLAKILEAMADKNRVLRTADLSILRYDRANDKLYLVDATHWAYQIVEYEITVDSPFVLEFGLWTEEDLATPQEREASQESKLVTDTASQESKGDLPIR